MMKNLGMLLPVGACALAAVWLSWNQREIVRLERENEVLGERIAVAVASGAGGTGAGPGAKKEEDAAAGPIDWEELGTSLMEATRGGAPDMRAMMELQRRLLEMDTDELMASLRELEALELSEQVREALEGMLIGMLIQKDPKLAIEAFGYRLRDSQGEMIGWQLAHAFQQWLGKEPQAAIEWYDARVAAGDFDSRSLDGRNQTRMQYEAALFISLLESDPEAAASRLEALPEDQRLEVFQQGGWELAVGTELALADLVREHLPEDKQAQALSRVSGTLAQHGGYERVSAFLGEIDASPEERKSVAVAAAETQLRMTQFNQGDPREAMQETRDWLLREAPEAADTITGEALAGMHAVDFAERAKWLEELHAEQGGDDLLVGFLDRGQARQNREESIRLAGLIADEERRSEILERLGFGDDARPAAAVEP